MCIFLLGRMSTASIIFKGTCDHLVQRDLWKKMGQWGLPQSDSLLSLNKPPTAGSLLSKQHLAASSFSIFPTIKSRSAWGHVLPRNTASLTEPGGNKDLSISPWHGCSDRWHSPQRASGYLRHRCTYINALFPKCVDPDKYLSPWTSCQNLLLENLTCEGKWIRRKIENYVKIKAQERVPRRQRWLSESNIAESSR